MKRRELYRSRLDETWQREIGKLSPRAFAHTIGGSQDLIQRLEQYAELEAHSGCVNTVHFNPTGEILVSGSDDMDIIFWDWAAKTKTLQFPSGHENNVFQARIMPFSDDRSVVTCAADGQVRHCFLSETGKVHSTRLAKHRGRAHKLAIEPGSPRTFFSCGEDGAVYHFDLREHKSTRLFYCSSSIPRRRPIHLNAIVINPRNPNFFAVGGSDEFARVYDIRKVGTTDTTNPRDYPVDIFAPQHLIGSKHVHITCLAYSLQEEMLVSYNDEHIYLFDKDMRLGPEPVKPSERKIGAANTNEENGADASENASGRQPIVYQGHRNAQTVKGVNFFGPNTEYVVSGSDCGHVFIWRKRDAQLITMMKGDKQVVNCLEPHPFTTILATSGIDSTVKIWAPTAPEKKPLPGQAAEKIMERNAKNRRDKINISLLAPEMSPDLLMLRLLHGRRLNHWLRVRRSSGAQEAQNGQEEEDEEEGEAHSAEALLNQVMNENGEEEDEEHGEEDEDDDDEDEDDEGGNPECIIA